MLHRILRDTIKKVGLIFIFIDSLEEVFRISASIMSSCNKVGPLFLGNLIKQFKLDLLITHNVRIWSVTFFKFRKHIVYNFLVVFFLKIEDTEVKIKLSSHPLSIS